VASFVVSSQQQIGGSAVGGPLHSSKTGPKCYVVHWCRLTFCYWMPTLYNYAWRLLER